MKLPISCPVCGKVPIGTIAVESNLTREHFHVGDSRPMVRRDRAATTEINFRCECGCEGHMTYEHPAKEGGK